ncbi:MAG: hypothetical protein FGM32_02415 [Candidatus Kapabacteria bacterium]|nr:hypothetical protein [Candidatus Kapabacteria bacterium]
MRMPIILLVISLVLGACASKDPVSPTPTGIKVPAVGSTFELDAYGTDPTGKKIPDSEYSLLQSVLASGAVFGGKSGVWSIESNDKVTGEPVDTSYMCLDSKQDVLLYFPDLSVDGSPKWFRLPVTTGLVSIDSASQTEDINGIPLQFTLKVKAERSTDEPILVGTSSISTRKIVMTVSVTILAQGQVIETIEFKQHLWFAPTLGTFAQRSSDAYEAGCDVQDGEFVKLTKYTLK